MKNWSTLMQEIYNYIELRNELTGKRIFKTDLIRSNFKMYREYGDCCVDKFNGIVCFLLYDKRKNLPLVARDHFGIKLYIIISLTKTGFFCIGDQSIVLSIRMHTRTLIFNAIREYLTFSIYLEHKKLYIKISRKSASGHLMVIDLKYFSQKGKSIGA